MAANNYFSGSPCPKSDTPEMTIKPEVFRREIQAPHLHPIRSQGWCCIAQAGYFLFSRGTVIQ
jgi:hypothetical protein